MYRTDETAFKATLTKCASVFGKELKNELCSAYWDALKDLPLSTVERCAESHIRYGKFFPKPNELRPKDDAPKTTRSAAMEVAFREGEERAAENLEELRLLNPARWLEVVTPKVTELGRAKGMLLGEIDAKIQRYLREGPRV